MNDYRLLWLPPVVQELSDDVNPVDYLAATLRAILDGHPQSGIEDLMPWRYAQPSSLAA